MEPHGQDMLICSRLGSEVGTIAADPTALGQGKRWNRRDLTVPEMTPSDIKSQMFASGDLGGAQKENGIEGTFGWLQAPATNHSLVQPGEMGYLSSHLTPHPKII